MLELELGNVVALLVLSVGRSTLSNCGRSSSAFCLLITELVNSSMEMSRVTGAEVAAMGNICGKETDI